MTRTHGRVPWVPRKGVCSMPWTSVSLPSWEPLTFGCSQGTCADRGDARIGKALGQGSEGSACAGARPRLDGTLERSEKSPPVTSEQGGHSGRWFSEVGELSRGSQRAGARVGCDRQALSWASHHGQGGGSSDSWTGQVLLTSGIWCSGHGTSYPSEGEPGVPRWPVSSPGGWEMTAPRA